MVGVQEHHSGLVNIAGGEMGGDAVVDMQPPVACLQGGWPRADEFVPIMKSPFHHECLGWPVHPVIRGSQFNLAAARYATSQIRSVRAVQHSIGTANLLRK